MPDFDIGKLIGYVELDDSGVAEGAKSAEDRISKLGNSGATLAKAAGVGMGLAIAGGLAGAVDLSAGRAKLTAQLDLSAEDSKRLGNVAGRLYAGAYGDSMDEVNEALRTVTQNIGGMADASDTDLERISGKVLNVSQAFDQDLGGVTRAVGTMLRTGLAKDADQALDVLTKGFQNGTNVADDLLDTFSEYGTQFRKLGLNATEATGLMSQGLKGGARDADVVADALKELSIRAVDGSKTTTAGFEALGLSADDFAAKFGAGGATAKDALDTVLDRLRGMTDPVSKAAAATDLFGTQSEDLGAALDALDLDGAAAGMGNVEGAAKRVGDALGGTAAAQFTTLKRSAEQFATTAAGAVLPVLSAVGGTVLDVVTPALHAVGTAVGAVADGFDSLPGPVQATVVTLAALVAMRDPLSGIFDNLKTSGADALDSIQLRAMYAREAMAAEGTGLVGGIRAAATAGETAAKGGLALMSGALGGPLGIAIAGVSIGLPLLTHLLGDNADEADKAAKSTGGFAEAIRNSNGVVDDAVRKAAAKEAQDRGLLDAAEAAGIGLDEVTDAILRGGDAYDAVKDKLDDYSNAELIAGGYSHDRANEHDKAATAAANAKDVLADLAHQLPENVDKEQQLAAASSNSADATDDAATAAREAADAAKAQADAYDALKSALDNYLGVNMDVDEANIALADGIAKLQEKGDGWSATLDTTTQTGRNNYGAVLDQIKGIEDLTTATYKQTGSADQARAAWDSQIGTLRDTLYALGYNVDEVDTLIGKYNNVPTSVFTSVGSNAGGVLATITTLKDKLETISRGTYYVDVYTNSRGGKSLGAGYGATGGVMSYYAEGGYFDPNSGRNLTPLAVGVAARVPANTWRVIGDRAVGDEFYLPDDDAPKSLAIGAEWLRRRGLAAVPLTRYADGGILAGTSSSSAAPSPSATGPADRATPSAVFTGPVYLRDERDAEQLAEDLDWRRRTRGGRR